MLSLHDTHAAVYRRSRGWFGCVIESRAHETGVGPFPDIAGGIEQSIFISPEGADRARLAVDIGGFPELRLALVACERAPRRIVRIHRHAIILPAAARRISPLLVG